MKYALVEKCLVCGKTCYFQKADGSFMEIDTRPVDAEEGDFFAVHRIGAGGEVSGAIYFPMEKIGDFEPLDRESLRFFENFEKARQNGLEREYGVVLAVPLASFAWKALGLRDVPQYHDEIWRDPGFLLAAAHAFGHFLKEHPQVSGNAALALFGQFNNIYIPMTTEMRETVWKEARELVGRNQEEAADPEEPVNVKVHKRRLGMRVQK